MKKQKAFFLGGKNGSYLEIETGEFADTVIGTFYTAKYIKNAKEAMDWLLLRDLDYADAPICACCSIEYIKQHVGC